MRVSRLLIGFKETCLKNLPVISTGLRGIELMSLIDKVQIYKPNGKPFATTWVHPL